MAIYSIIVYGTCIAKVPTQDDYDIKNRICKEYPKVGFLCADDAIVLYIKDTGIELDKMNIIYMRETRLQDRVMIEHAAKEFGIDNIDVSWIFYQYISPFNRIPPFDN